jgi:hypothetical protein
MFADIPYDASRIEFSVFDGLHYRRPPPRRPDPRGVRKPNGWKCYGCQAFVPAGTLHACPR